MNSKRAKAEPAAWMLAGLLGTLLGWVQEVEAAKRIALVIGNGAYADKPLTHPKRDAEDMAALLRGLGFEVTEATDLKLVWPAGAGVHRRRARGQVRLFYYSGHGANYQNQSYLLPVGHDIQDHDEVLDQGFPVQALLRGLRAEDPKGASLVLLDACRDEPFGESQIHRRRIQGRGPGGGQRRHAGGLRHRRRPESDGLAQRTQLAVHQTPAALPEGAGGNPRGADPGAPGGVSGRPERPVARERRQLDRSALFGGSARRAGRVRRAGNGGDAESVPPPAPGPDGGPSVPGPAERRHAGTEDGGDSGGGVPDGLAGEREGSKR